MDDLLARATQGIDPDAPGAFWHVFMNLLNMLPWTTIFWWNVAFVLVGAGLGWWRGRMVEGIVWAWVLGPIGWIVLLFRSRTPHRPQPPPLPR
ncbi:MAG TPA: hypothetical protein VIL60_13635 [Rhodanobacter sp.]